MKRRAKFKKTSPLVGAGKNPPRPKQSQFHYQVYRLAEGIPRGRVTTYGVLARLAGNPRAARAVGNAMHRNPHAPRVPCHRVVRSRGEIGGYARGVRAKVRLLAREGVRVARGRVDLRRYGWRVK